MGRAESREAQKKQGGFTARAPKEEPLQIWIDHLSDDGLDILEDPIAISASRGQWFLKDFCSRPKTEWSRIMLPDET